jgi:dienelactone hydrolase
VPRPGRLAAVVVTLLALLLTGSSIAHLSVGEVSGPHPVGRERLTLVDPARPEPATAAPGDRRAVPLQVWYPAIPGTGQPAPYVEDLGEIAPELAASDSVGWLATQGLRWVRDPARAGAQVAALEGAAPVVVLSPGHDTNVAFYASLAEELASHGYVVMGIDHPFQVTAVALPDGSVATVGEDAGLAPGRVEAGIDERVADIAFVLEQITREAPDLDFLADAVDPDRVGVIGHSNGGLAAVEACRRLAAVDACVNIDGQNQGGPFGTSLDDSAPDRPFLFVTKEADLHPQLEERFEASTAPAARIVVPAASHGDFTDGERFAPGINPLPGRADAVGDTSAGAALAFFDRWLRDDPSDPFDHLPAATDVYVNVYPLGDRPPIPAGD